MYLNVHNLHKYVENVLLFLQIVIVIITGGGGGGGATTLENTVQMKILKVVPKNWKSLRETLRIDTKRQISFGAILKPFDM